MDLRRAPSIQRWEESLDHEKRNWLDLLVANDLLPSYFYRNRRDGTFSDESYMSGLALSGEGREQASMGIGVGRVPPHRALCDVWVLAPPGCIEITIKLGGKTLALLSKRYYVTHKSKGAYSAHTFAKNANVLIG